MMLIKVFLLWGFGGRAAEGPVLHCFNLDGTATGFEDEILTDLQEIIYALVRASDLPLSILIVGLGRVDFKQMEILDADNGQRLSSSTEHESTVLSKNNYPPPIAKAKGKGKSVATDIVIDN
ncbi:hypothetical protein ACLB2K_040438 [Fragaria x ananassa]